MPAPERNRGGRTPPRHAGYLRVAVLRRAGAFFFDAFFFAAETFLRVAGVFFATAFFFLAGAFFFDARFFTEVLRAAMWHISV